MRPLRQSALITFFSSNLNAIVQFGVTVVLARLLTPQEVGIFSITVMLTNIVAIFRDFGVSSYLQVEKDLTAEKIQSALGFLLASSWLLALIIYGASPWAAAYFREPGVGEVMRVISLSFVIVPFASFFYSLLARNLEAGQQAIVNAVGTFAYAGSCLGLAWAGFSYLSMAWANVINIASTVVVYLLLKPSHLPLRPGFAHWRPIARFGSGAILGGIIDKVNTAVPDLVLGRVSGAHDVGLYSRAGGLIGIFGQVVGPTLSYSMVPYLAHQHRNNIHLGPALAKGTAYIAAGSWPFFIVLGVMAADVIQVLYGARWLDAAPLAAIMALAAAVRTALMMGGAGLMAIGRPALTAWSGGASLLLRLGLLAVAASNDLMVIATLIALADLASAGLLGWQMVYYLGLRTRALLGALTCSALVCLPLLAWVLWASHSTWLASWAPWTRLLVVCGLVPALWLLGALLCRHPIAHELPALVTRLGWPAAGQWVARHLSEHSATTPPV